MDKNGAIKAMVGGVNYNKSQFNRALSENRQVGSTIKPFLYYSALENGFTPSTTFTSEKTTFHYNNNSYSPSNYHNSYPNQEISLAYAMAVSDNIYAVKTHMFLGMEKLKNAIEQLQKPMEGEQISFGEVSTDEG